MASPSVSTAQPIRLSATPRASAGESLLPKLLIVALLALAVFFYIRAIAPPAEELSGDTPQALAEPPITPAAAPDAAPPAADSEPSPVAAPAADGPDSQPLQASENPAGEPPAEPPTAAAQAATAEPAATPAEPVNAGPVPVPTAQIDLIKQVFAPELAPAQ